MQHNGHKHIAYEAPIDPSIQMNKSNGTGKARSLMTYSLNRWFGKKLRERHRRNLQKWINCLKAYHADFLTTPKIEIHFRKADFQPHTITKKVVFGKYAQPSARESLSDLHCVSIDIHIARGSINKKGLLKELRDEIYNSGDNYAEMKSRW